jgi:hypothetical protein
MPKPLEDMTEPELKALTLEILDGVAAKLPKPAGFAVLFWPIGHHNVAQYGSNIRRDVMIECLRWTADRLERKQDVPR